MRRSTMAGVVGMGAVLAAFVVLPLGCGSPKDPWEGKPGPPRVVATFPPLACFVQNVGGDDVGVLTLCTTTGPHEFDPTADDKRMLQKADIFVVNGLGLEDRFAELMTKSSGNARMLGKGDEGVLNLGKVLLDAKLVDKAEAHDEHEEHDHHHHHGQYDPHVWLGIPEAIAMVEAIRDRLKFTDPARHVEYFDRAKDYVAKLKTLHQEGKTALADKKNRKIITAHESLHYFAKSFDIEVADVIQIQPGTDPDLAMVQDIVQTCQKEGVRVIATEPGFRPQTAESLVKELARKGVTDIQIIELDPLEVLSKGDKLDEGWYERRMRANIDELKKALR